jgi:hypothetical protein
MACSVSTTARRTLFIVLLPFLPVTPPQVEGAWVLYPPNGRQPEAVVHFLGDAFVGAAPQLSYRLFLEALSNRDILVSNPQVGTLLGVCTSYGSAGMPCLSRDMSNRDRSQG